MAEEPEAFLPEIRYLVFRECGPDWRLKRHESVCCDLTWLIGGAARYTIDGVDRELAAGDLLCLREGALKEARTYAARPMRCFSVNFQALNPRGEPVYPPFPVLSRAGVREDIAALFYELVYAWTEARTGYTLKTRGLLLLILHRLLELTLYRPEARSRDPRVERALQYIDRCFAERITVESLAAAAGLNAAYFGVLFKREAGMSVSRAVARARVRAAQNLLKSGAYRVCEAADAVGYVDIYHFYKQFKSLTGLSPKTFLKQPF
jgi:AraC-like DNA-binding protein